MIALNKSNHTFPTAAADKNEIIAKPSDIANTFNNYFVNNAIDFHPPSDFPWNILLLPATKYLIIFYNSNW